MCRKFAHSGEGGDVEFGLGGRQDGACGGNFITSDPAPCSKCNFLMIVA